MSLLNLPPEAVFTDGEGLYFDPDHIWRQLGFAATVQSVTTSAGNRLGISDFDLVGTSAQRPDVNSRQLINEIAHAPRFLIVKTARPGLFVTAGEVDGREVAIIIMFRNGDDLWNIIWSHTKIIGIASGREIILCHDIPDCLYRLSVLRNKLGGDVIPRTGRVMMTDYAHYKQIQFAIYKIKPRGDWQLTGRQRHYDRLAAGADADFIILLADGKRSVHRCYLADVAAFAGANRAHTIAGRRPPVEFSLAEWPAHIVDLFLYIVYVGVIPHSYSPAPAETTGQLSQAFSDRRSTDGRFSFVTTAADWIDINRLTDYLQADMVQDLLDRVSFDGKSMPAYEIAQLCSHTEQVCDALHNIDLSTVDGGQWPAGVFVNFIETVSALVGDHGIPACVKKYLAAGNELPAALEKFVCLRHTARA
ncbi:MAG: hypothetical protein WDA28_13250 [Castellaniella sp.]